MNAPLPNPSVQDGRATCTGPRCPLYNPTQGGWCMVTQEPGQRDRTGAFRTCHPYIAQKEARARHSALSVLRVPCRIQQLPHARGLDLPAYETRFSAGMDVRAAVDGTVTVHPGCTVAIPTGLVIAVPEGFEIQVRPRSGFAKRHQITVGNSPGTIDADYRGQLWILVINHGTEPFEVTRGMRIAQLVLGRAPRAVWEVCEDLVGEATERGAGGLGSTGVA